MDENDPTNLQEYLLDEQRRLEEEEWERQAREAAGEEQPNVEQILKELIEQQQQEQLENAKNGKGNQHKMNDCVLIVSSFVQHALLFSF